jgi:sugar (pentulose or hexulose) kinase
MPTNQKTLLPTRLKNNMSDCVLAVDVGSTSLKAALIDRDGRVASICTVPYSAPENRFVAEGWIWALKAAVDKLVPADGSLRQAQGPLAAIAISGNGPTLVSESGLTLRWSEYPAARLNIDETSPDEAHEFAHSIFLPRILLFRDLIGDEYESTSHLFSGPEYLIWQLTGNAVTILPEPRYETAYWNAQVLEGFGIMTGKMPAFVELGHNCGTLLDNAQELLGLPAVPVIGVGPDFIAALIGTDTTEPGRICDRAGSSEGINMCVDKEIRAEGVRTLPGVKAGLWNISVLIPDSASLPEEVRLQKVTDAIGLLKNLAAQNDIAFPTVITTTGGQAKDKAYFEKKRAALATLGLELVVGSCVDAELEGDAKVAWREIL